MIFADIGEGKPHFFVRENEITLADKEAYSIWKKNKTSSNQSTFSWSVQFAKLFVTGPKKWVVQNIQVGLSRQSVSSVQ